MKMPPRPLSPYGGRTAGRTCGCGRHGPPGDEVAGTPSCGEPHSNGGSFKASSIDFLWRPRLPSVVSKESDNATRPAPALIRLYPHHVSKSHAEAGTALAFAAYTSAARRRSEPTASSRALVIFDFVRNLSADVRGINYLHVHAASRSLKSSHGFPRKLTITHPKTPRRKAKIAGNIVDHIHYLLAVPKSQLAAPIEGAGRPVAIGYLSRRDFRIGCERPMSPLRCAPAH